jgi:hypothetical protein
MRLALAALTIALIASPVAAQSVMDNKGKNSTPKLDPAVEARQKRDAEEIDKAYKAAIGKNSEPSKKLDPWGDVRPADAKKK